MSTSPVFEWVGAALQEHTSLQAAQARGSLRLALRAGGLDAANVTVSEMVAVLDRLLPEQLRKAGVANPPSVCLKLSIGLKSRHFDEDEAVRKPEAFFRRVLGPRPAR
jgi:hypothetical protein